MLFRCRLSLSQKLSRVVVAGACDPLVQDVTILAAASSSARRCAGVASACSLWCVRCCQGCDEDRSARELYRSSLCRFWQPAHLNRRAHDQHVAFRSATLVLAPTSSKPFVRHPCQADLFRNNPAATGRFRPRSCLAGKTLGGRKVHLCARRSGDTRTQKRFLSVIERAGARPLERHRAGDNRVCDLTSMAGPHSSHRGDARFTLDGRDLHGSVVFTANRVAFFMSDRLASVDASAAQCVAETTGNRTLKRSARCVAFASLFAAANLAL